MSFTFTADFLVKSRSIGTQSGCRIFVHACVSNGTTKSIWDCNIVTCPLHLKVIYFLRHVQVRIVYILWISNISYGCLNHHLAIELWSSSTIKIKNRKDQTVTCPIKKSDMGVSKNRGKTPQIIHFNRVFHYFHHPFWVSLCLGQHPKKGGSTYKGLPLAMLRMWVICLTGEIKAHKLLLPKLVSSWQYLVMGISPRNKALLRVY